MQLNHVVQNTGKMYSCSMEISLGSFRRSTSWQSNVSVYNYCVLYKLISFKIYRKIEPSENLEVVVLRSEQDPHIFREGQANVLRVYFIKGDNGIYCTKINGKFPLSYEHWKGPRPTPNSIPFPSK